MTLKKVIVNWLDNTSVTDKWYSVEEATKLELPIVETVGYLIDDGDAYTIISSSTVCPEEDPVEGELIEQVKEVHVFLKPLVLSVKELEERKSG